MFCCATAGRFELAEEKYRRALQSGHAFDEHHPVSLAVHLISGSACRNIIEIEDMI